MVDQGAVETKTKGPRTGVRKTFLVLTWVILAGIATQVLLIGLGLFYKCNFAEAHIGFGWGFGHLGPALLILGFFGRLGKGLTILNAINLVLFLALPFLASARDSSAVVAGLHPLVALTVFSLTGYTAMRVRALIAANAASAQASGPRLVPPPTQQVVQGRIIQNTNR